MTKRKRLTTLWAGQAAGDTLNQVKLKFPSQEEAVAFAESKGWDYVVMKPHARKPRPRNYGDNFKYIPPKTGENAKSSSKKEA